MTSRIRPKVASSETAREINRTIVLRTIHRHQPVSRADVVRLTGLQPSTVSAIVESLIQENWLITGPPAQLPRGRKPESLAMNQLHVALTIDLHPDHANLGVVDINGRILDWKTLTFSSSKESKVDARRSLVKVAQAACTMRSTGQGLLFEGTGVSIAGRANQKERRLIFSPNAGWSGLDLYKVLESTLQSPVEIDNAANASLLSERWFGRFWEAKNIIAVSVSEGIGTALILDGRLVRGEGYMAGEFGHMSLNDAGPTCGCGNKGCWETLASNRAGIRYYLEAGSKSKAITFHDLLKLAIAGDRRALDSLDKMAGELGRGLAILSAGLSPEVILIVGDCTAHWSRIGPILEKQLRDRSLLKRIPRLIPALEGDSARLRGAAALVFQKSLFGDAESS